MKKRKTTRSKSGCKKKKKKKKNSVVSHFYISLYISFIYEDIFTKYAKNVYVSENMSVKKFGLVLKNKMATIADCSKVSDMF